MRGRQVFLLVLLRLFLRRLVQSQACQINWEMEECVGIRGGGERGGDLPGRECDPVMWDEVRRGEWMDCGGWLIVEVWVHGGPREKGLSPGRIGDGWRLWGKVGW